MTIIINIRNECSRHDHFHLHWSGETSHAAGHILKRSQLKLLLLTEESNTVVVYKLIFKLIALQLQVEEGRKAATRVSS